MRHKLCVQGPKCPGKVGDLWVKSSSLRPTSQRLQLKTQSSKPFEDPVVLTSDGHGEFGRSFSARAVLCVSWLRKPGTAWQKCVSCQSLGHTTGSGLGIF